MPHPGQLLADELRILNMSASELARRIQVPTNRVTKILNGQRAITADTALRLAHFFGTGADFWLTLQSLHELGVAEAKSGKVIHQLPTLLRHSGPGNIREPQNLIERAVIRSADDRLDARVSELDEGIGTPKARRVARSSKRSAR